MRGHGLLVVVWTPLAVLEDGYMRWPGPHWAKAGALELYRDRVVRAESLDRARGRLTDGNHEKKRDWETAQEKHTP